MGILKASWTATSVLFSWESRYLWKPVMPRKLESSNYPFLNPVMWRHAVSLYFSKMTAVNFKNDTSQSFFFFLSDTLQFLFLAAWCVWRFCFFSVSDVFMDMTHCQTTWVLCLLSLPSAWQLQLTWFSGLWKVPGSCLDTDWLVNRVKDFLPPRAGKTGAFQNWWLLFWQP